MKTNLNKIKVDFLKTLTDKDYKFIYSYCRVDEACEIVRINNCSSLSILPINISELSIEKEVIYFVDTKKEFSFEYKCIQNKNTNMFDLFEITLDAFNRFEQYYRENS